MTYDEMARVREDITDIKDSVEELTDKQDVIEGVIEGVTANNWAEIVKMRNRKKQA